MFQSLKMTNAILLCLIFLILTAIPISSLSAEKTLLNKIQNNILEINPSNIIEMIQQVNKTKLTNHLQKIQDFGPHKTGSDTLELVGEYIYNELSKNNLLVEYKHWTNEEYSGKNIVATLKGIVETNRIIIVCAHYDSVKVSPGADDDGSGVAIVLMLAEIMSKYSFNSTIKFILFSGEEQGKLGSCIYAKNAKNNKDNIVGVLALDKVGYAKTTEEGQKVVHHSNVKSDWMVEISTNMAIKYYDHIGLDVVHRSQDPGSDHIAFINQGYHGSDFVRYGVNPFYHTSEDKIEHLNMTYLTKVCKLTLATLAKIADLNSGLKNDEINIVVKGNYFSELGQIYIKVENLEHEKETANVTIDISLRHIFRNKLVKMKKKHYDVPSKWFLTKEIEDYWEFLVGGHIFTKGLIKLEVVVQGINDDIHLYKKQVTYGFMFDITNIRIIPRF